MSDHDDAPEEGTIRARVIRTVSSEEQVSFDGVYESPAAANAAVETQLALVRDHMRRYNEEVHLVDERKRDELTAAVSDRGEELKRLDRAIAEKAAEVAKLDRKLRRVG